MADGFRLTSTDFAEGEPIPARFTCDGEDVSPELSWEGAPDGTETLTLVVDDPDAHAFVHWVVYNMVGSQTGALPEGVSAGHEAPAQGRNSFGRIGWNGPCPPSGTHRYRFTLYALDATLELAGAPEPDELRQALQGHILDSATLTGRYARGGADPART